MFDNLGSGLGGADAVRMLRATRYSRHLLLIEFLLTRVPDDPEPLRDLLERSRSAAPDRFAAVIRAPMVGGWAAIAGRGAARRNPDPRTLAHLAAIALVAAAAAEIDGSVSIPVDHGVAMLPGLGAVVADGLDQVEAMTSQGRISVVVDGARVDVPADPVAGSAAWLPLRKLDAGSVRLDLEDLHPYRHGHHAPPAGRLGPAEVERWRTLVAESWQLLTDLLPDRAAELSAGLSSLVPLIDKGRGSALSASLRDVFGACGLTRPTSPDELAVTLVHEFQHSKLSALLELKQLTDPSDDGRYFAPWRTDPRPLAGLLQGVYAFVGVADTWRALRGTVADAELRFAKSRLQVERGLTAVEQSGALTADGVRFAAALRRTVDAMLAEPVPAETARAAEQALARIRSAWELENQGIH
ncbi:aKG-HExxH-type peptide beta-hydroxylase [Actinoplanes sp. NPDC049668]|uniref:aKG-HExxH-type peptide beta-hydroxylase n=1 Tax=unclassified Actinoplanes TaxID=2626549 RepID=UPI0033A09B73